MDGYGLDHCVCICIVESRDSDECGNVFDGILALRIRSVSVFIRHHIPHRQVLNPLLYGI